MTPIGTVGKIKITENGMIANVNLDNSYRSDLMIKLYQLEERQYKLEFKKFDLQRIREEIKSMGYAGMDKLLLKVEKQIDEEIKFLKRVMKKLSK
jgi:hypothetical protein